jgi:hypothetical protein
MRCGAAATAIRAKTFWARQPWYICCLLSGIAILPGLVIQRLVSKRISIEVPLCAAHKNHFLWRTWVVKAILPLVLLGWFSYLIVRYLPNTPKNVSDEFFRWLAVAAFVWAVLLWIAEFTGINADAVTDHGASLVGVCKKFVQAYQEQTEPNPFAGGNDENPFANLDR